ncbi:hypothetical protein EDD70_0944 [Hydrogenoanaerobacterium saccharovorans]|uniref:Uncharacterized protein n=1 Tax=Hydrogenoanaerobacterium saccharovorans TaxID=474960 RepID=A0A1H8A6Z0_9FIRM|nr:hypothetical protein [Hydrogenoanaerobacterium saccharovorans]RPF48131.1 hypothetical protein EDD70_0944 [Hydrogenoanaerobacterium saccharovorans]SEM66246.1 hypothetical protein SAMN05216180_1147 [Hydrogenoanaerobacterium saccharovorans]
MSERMPDFVVKISDGKCKIKYQNKRFQSIGFDLSQYIYDADVDNENDIEIIKEGICTITPEGVHIQDKEGKDIERVNCYVSTCYSRNTNDKVINKLPVSKNEDINLKLLEYDRILAIDTNTKTINDKIFSITSIIQSNPIQSINDKELYFWQYCKQWSSINVDKPENFAWAKVIDSANFQINSKKCNHSVAVIVDSDLDKIEKFNARHLPIWGDFYLPKNFNLIYASADTGGELLPNILIRKCDKFAKQALDLVK